MRGFDDVYFASSLFKVLSWLINSSLDTWWAQTMENSRSLSSVNWVLHLNQLPWPAMDSKRWDAISFNCSILVSFSRRGCECVEERRRSTLLTRQFFSQVDNRDGQTKNSRHIFTSKFEGKSYANRCFFSLYSCSASLNRDCGRLAIRCCTWASLEDEPISACDWVWVIICDELPGGRGPVALDWSLFEADRGTRGKPAGIFVGALDRSGMGGAASSSPTSLGMIRYL